jgi:hypothetical protein
LTCIPWAQLGLEENNTYSIIVTVLSGIFSLIVVVQIILIDKSIRLKQPKNSLLYAFPSYLIYSLYFTLAFLFGLPFLILPGIYIGIMLSLTPIASILVDDHRESFFKISFKLVKKDFLLVFFFLLFNILLEVLSVAFDFIPDWKIRLFTNLFFSFGYAFMLIVLTKTSVNIFYYLDESLKKEGLKPSSSDQALPTANF